MTPRFSVVLPVHNQADHIEGIVHEYVASLEAAKLDSEIVLVPNNCRDESAAICRRLVGEHPGILVEELELGGWGRAVRAGLASCTGTNLCYTNSARTTPEMLVGALALAADCPNVVVKAQRRMRDNFRRRAGSVIYNFECRMLFNLATWDINGTPKVFPRHFERLLALRRDDDLIDLEFLVACTQASYPIVELPVSLTSRHGGQSTTRLSSAWRMYRGAVGLWLGQRQ